MSNKKYYLGWLMAFIAVSLFSTKAIIVKLIYQVQDIDAITTVALRMIFSFPIFIIIALKTWKPLTKKQVYQIIIAGFLGYYAASLLDFIALKYISSSLERLILFLNPGIVLILSWIFFKHKINKFQCLSLILGYISVFIVFMHESLNGSNIVLGVILAFASVVSYALYVILCSSLLKTMEAIRLTSLATCIASILCIAQFYIIEPSPNQILLSLPFKIYWLSAINALFCTVIPVLLTMLAIQSCGPGITSQTGIIGPMITIFLGAALLNEKLTIYHAVGTFGVILSMIILSKGIIVEKAKT